MSFKDEVGELSERGSLRLVSCLALYLALPRGANRPQRTAEIGTPLGVG
jgi:hypothetical protein